MEMTTSATTQSHVSQPRTTLAITVLGAVGGYCWASLKGAGLALADPMTCNVFWIGSSPLVWGSKR